MDFSEALGIFPSHHSHSAPIFVDSNSKFGVQEHYIYLLQNCNMYVENSCNLSIFSEKVSQMDFNETLNIFSSHLSHSTPRVW